MSGALLAVLARTTLSAGAMILAVAALRSRFAGETPRRVFCLLWDMVLVRLLLPLEISSPWSIRTLLGGRLPGNSGASGGTAALWELPANCEIVLQKGLSSPAEQTCLMSSGAAGPDWTAALAALWLAGLLACGGWLLWGHLRSRRIYASSLPVCSAAAAAWQAVHPLRRPVQVRCSDRITSPLTYGVLRPVVLLPSGLERMEGGALEYVLEHEYTHIRRFDALRKGFLALGLSLHWFNPLVWVMYVLAGRDMELSCDEAVVRSGADRRRYALALLRLEDRRRRLTGSFFSRSPLEERIEAIMKLKKFSFTALIAVLAAMSIATTVFATSAPEEKESPLRVGAHLTTYAEAVEDSSITSMLDENGNMLYSADGGKTWMSEERYLAQYGNGWGDGWDVEWWTPEDYAAWLEQEKKELQECIGDRAYTASTGWFTWDQEKVDETIALYESILEDIQNGALYSKTVRDRDGNLLDDVALGSDGPMNMVVASTFDESDRGRLEEDVFRSAGAAELLSACAPFGLTGSEADGLFYNGQRVRRFVDGVSVGGGGYGVRYSYVDEAGTVDVHTLRSVLYNPDGSYNPMGDLIGLAAAGDSGFDRGLIDCAKPSFGSQSAFAEGSSRSGDGKTFEEIFAQYEAYGLTCTSGVNSFVDLSYSGQPVRQFADLRPDGSAFTYENPYCREGLSLYAVYDESGALAGLRAA